MKITPTFSRFCELAKKGNILPIYGEVLADQETPVSAYRKMSKNGIGFLLESVEGGRSQARYSIVGYTVQDWLKFDQNKASIKAMNGQLLRSKEKDPLRFLEKHLSKYQSVTMPNLPRFCGGAVGYIAYDYNRFCENIKNPKTKIPRTPDLYFMVSRKLLVFDHLFNKIKIVQNALIPKKATKSRLKQIYNDVVHEVKEARDCLRKPLPVISKTAKTGRGSRFVLKSNFTKARFKRSVKAIKRHIYDGDVIQAVLSQQFRRKSTVDAFDIYRALRTINPSPYMFYLNYGDLEIVGSSPELHVRCEDDRVELKPIAGTRPRGKSEDEDIRLEMELSQDPKEQAEHVMLVDLGRNDLGRISETGSVHATEFMSIERYSHVMHIVSKLKSKKKTKASIYDVIRATFPAGTVSGAPKVRAMQIIAGEEPQARGIYSGLVGYLSYSGNLDSCITIRTVLVKNGEVFIQAGAGIVADSDPEKEWEETINKAKGLFSAVSMAERGLQ